VTEDRKVKAPKIRKLSLSMLSSGRLPKVGLYTVQDDKKYGLFGVLLKIIISPEWNISDSKTNGKK